MFSTFVADFDEFQKCADIRMRYLGVATPTSTTVGVTARTRFHDRDRGRRRRQFLRSGSGPTPVRWPGNPDPSTGQTGSVAAPIEDVLSRGDWLLDAVQLSRSQQELRR